MKKELVIKQSSKLSLAKTKNLLGITNKLLAKRNDLTACSVEEWMVRLWGWADRNDIDEEKLPRESWALLHLLNLDLADKYLFEIPKEIGQLTQLTCLNLGDWTPLNDEQSAIGSNNLSELPKEIGQLTQLTYLSLNSNNLNELPVEIGQLAQLGILMLNDNNLNELPAEIGQLTQLKYLDLSNNNLNELPKEIGQLTQLTGLIFSDNNINELPSEIGQLSNLGDLHLENNNLSESEHNTLQDTFRETKCQLYF